MDEHALPLLARTELWGFPNTVKPIRVQESDKQNEKLETITSKLLYYLILESQKLGGEMLNQFWYQFGECYENLKENIENLKRQPYQSLEMTCQVLFEGLGVDYDHHQRNIDYSPLLNLAAEFFTCGII